MDECSILLSSSHLVYVHAPPPPPRGPCPSICPIHQSHGTIGTPFNVPLALQYSNLSIRATYVVCYGIYLEVYPGLGNSSESQHNFIICSLKYILSVSVAGLHPNFCHLQYEIFFPRCQKKSCGMEPGNEATGPTVQWD